MQVIQTNMTRSELKIEDIFTNSTKFIDFHRASLFKTITSIAPIRDKIFEKFKNSTVIHNHNIILMYNKRT